MKTKKRTRDRNAILKLKSLKSNLQKTRVHTANVVFKVELPNRVCVSNTHLHTTTYNKCIRRVHYDQPKKKHVEIQEKQNNLI